MALLSAQTAAVGTEDGEASEEVRRLLYCDVGGWPLALERFALTAEAALTSPDPTSRNRAGAALRHLSAFEHLPTVRRIIESTTNPHLLFIAGKAYAFIVSNEIGPQERAGTQERILARLSEIHHQIPRFAFNQLAAVYAIAVYLNWRLSVLNVDDGRGDSGAETLARVIDVQVRSSLPPLVAMMLMGEVLHHFSREDNRSTLHSVRTSFAFSVLPHFFRHAVSCLTGESGGLLCEATENAALELCCGALEFAPPLSIVPLVDLHVTSEETLYLHPPGIWAEVLLQCARYCAGRYCGGGGGDGDGDSDACAASRPSSTTSSHLLQCLRHISCVALDPAGDTHVVALCQDIFTLLLQLSCDLLERFRRYRETDVLDESVRILLNVTERHPHEVCEWLLTSSADFIPKLCATHASLSSMWGLMGNASALECIVQFFCVVHDHLPAGAGDAADIARWKIQEAFAEHFDAVLAQCHLAEGSEELMLSDGVRLHSEQRLSMLARMLLCAQGPLALHVKHSLDAAVHQHEICRRIRAGCKVEEEALMEIIAHTAQSLLLTLDDRDLALAVNHIVLSRLAAIVGTLALVVQARGDSTILDNLLDDLHADTFTRAISSFVNGFFSEDISDALLSLSLSGSPSASSASPYSREFHLGIVRALLFFASSVQGSVYGRDEGLAQLMVHLCHFTLTHYSHHLVLVGDVANLLTSAAQCTGEHGASLCSADGVAALLECAVQGEIGLLSRELDVASFAGAGLSEKQVLGARKSLLAALVSVIERRWSLSAAKAEEHFAALVDLVMKDTPLALASIRGVVRNLYNPHLLGVLVDELCWAVESSIGIRVAELPREVRATAPAGTACFDVDFPCKNEVHLVELIHTLAKVAARCLVLDRQRNVPEHYIFAFVAVRAVEACLLAQQAQRTQPSERLVYDISAILASLCSGTWCNLGVLMYYGDTTIETVFYGAVELLLSVEVDLILSSTKKRDRIFRAISAALQVTADPSPAISALFARAHVWPRLVRYLLHCLQRAFSQHVVRCLELIIGCDTGVTKELEKGIIHEVMREFMVVLATTSLAQEEGAAVVRVLASCHMLDPYGCESVLEELLDFASAYHRIRIRCVLNMLRDPPSDLAASFFSVFTSSKVSTLTAW